MYITNAMHSGYEIMPIMLPISGYADKYAIKRNPERLKTTATSRRISMSTNIRNLLVPVPILSPI